MENTALDLKNLPMDRILEFRPNLRWMYHLLTWGTLTSCACLLAISAWQIREGHGLMATLSLVSTILFFLGGVVAPWLTLRPSGHLKVRVSQRGLTLDDGGARRELNFEQIRTIHLKTGRFIFETFSGEMHEFSLALERCDYILDGLIAANPVVVDMPNFEKYRHRAVIWDHMWARAYDSLNRELPMLLSLFVGLPLLATAVEAYHSGRWQAQWLVPIFFSLVLLNAVLGASTWLFRERVLRRRKHLELMENSLHALRDMPLEKKFRFRARLAHALLFVAASVWVLLL